MSDKFETKGSGIGLSGALFLVFLTLKLGVGSTAVVNWSWWAVCAPLWVPLALIIPILLFVALSYGLLDKFKPTFPFSRKKFSKVKKLRKSFQKNNIDWDQFAEAMDRTVLNTNFDVDLDIDDEKSYQKSIRKKAQKDRFSLKRWWKEGVKGQTLWQKVASWYREGNKKSEEKKALKSENKS